MKAQFILAVCSAAVFVLAASAPVTAQERTVKACQEEWRANRAANEKAGITEKNYVDKCRAGAVTALPAAKPAASAAPASAAAGSGQFATEAQAKLRCPRDTVVWVNLESKIYHFAGHKDYGHTKSGTYMCERNTAAEGFRAAKDETHP